MTRSTLLAAPVLCAVLLAPGPAAAQDSGYYIRVAPGFARATVEHTKEVQVGQAFGTSFSGTSGFELAARLSGGFRGRRGLDWYLALEVEGVLYAPGTIEGDIEPTGGDAPFDIQPGKWEYINKLGAGVNVVLERVVGGPNQRLLFFAGVHRFATEVASGGTHLGTGEFEEDRSIRSRWPFTGGAGFAMGPISLRVSYFRSLINWSFLSPEIEVHYKWQASGVSASMGVEVF